MLSVAERGRWVLLAYRLPREPSTPRIALWRKLRRLGAAQLLDGLVALPLDSRNRERLEWLAEEVNEAGGDASVWIGELTSAREERELAQRMAEEVAKEYGAIADEAAAAATSDDRSERLLERLRRELRRVRARDYFPTDARRAAEAALERLSESLRVRS